MYWVGDKNWPIADLALSRMRVVLAVSSVGIPRLGAEGGLSNLISNKFPH